MLFSLPFSKVDSYERNGTTSNVKHRDRYSHLVRQPTCVQLIHSSYGDFFCCPIFEKIGQRVPSHRIHCNMHTALFITSVIRF